MKKILLALVALSLAIPASAGRVFVCDPNDAVVPHRVVRFSPSADEGRVRGRLDVLINPSPDERSFSVAPTLLKCAGGDGVTTAYQSLVEMTQAEKDALAAATDPPKYQERGVWVGAADDRPTCTAPRRGAIYIQKNGPGVADQCFVCLKTTADTGVWAEIQVVFP